jgi:hypothetical protein
LPRIGKERTVPSQDSYAKRRKLCQDDPVMLWETELKQFMAIMSQDRLAACLVSLSPIVAGDRLSSRSKERVQLYRTESPVRNHR